MYLIYIDYQHEIPYVWSRCDNRTWRLSFNLRSIMIGADFQKVSCYVFEQRIVFHNDAVQNIYTMYSILKVKKQSGIGFIIDALFGNSRTEYKLCIDTLWKAAKL